MEVCVLRVGGTNCDAETAEAFENLEGVNAEVVHINRLGKEGNLFDFDCLAIPGGFSYGDHIRAGTVFANEIITSFGENIRNFAENGGLILGICNGFQVLVETGLLPGFNGISRKASAALAINESARYECRWVYLKNDNRGKCAFTTHIEEEVLRMPVAHKEGRFMLEKNKEKELLKSLQENDQIVFRYCDSKGEYAEGKYPENPNGSLDDIAGICDPSGRIFGLMPHPERAYYGYHLPDWTRQEQIPDFSDGRKVFESVVKFMKEEA